MRAILQRRSRLWDIASMKNSRRDLFSLTKRRISIFFFHCRSRWGFYFLNNYCFFWWDQLFSNFWPTERMPASWSHWHSQHLWIHRHKQIEDFIWESRTWARELDDFLIFWMNNYCFFWWDEIFPIFGGQKECLHLGAIDITNIFGSTGKNRLRESEYHIINIISSSSSIINKMFSMDEKI